MVLALSPVLAPAFVLHVWWAWVWSSSLVSAQTQPQPMPCIRWSGQIAIANAPPGTSGNASSTLWYYGGEAKTTSDQTENIWTNALLSIDLNQDWPTGTPPISLIQADDGVYTNPPAVALGALWASADGTLLFQYGGQFSDSPSVSPPVESIFQYDIASSTWTTVVTQGDTINRAAEGSSALVPGEGNAGDNVGYYFSGHLDSHTTQGWSNQVPRIYLNSLVTFDLGNLTVQNITSYSDTASTSNNSRPQSEPLYRADGTLTYIPNLGTNNMGVLVAIGGATATQYIDNSVLDVYDIGGGGWTKQSTLGDTIGSRVNHCAVRASATTPDGVATHQIFVYGGQQLNQTARDSALYILTVQESTYTWTFVGDDLSGQPSGRAGHQCALQGNQLIVIGGLVAGDILCDQPGVYVYNVSGSVWQDSFTAATTYQIPSLIQNITGETTTTMTGTSSSSTSTSTSTASLGGIGSGTGIVASQNSTSKAKTSTGAIAGGVVGGLLILLIGLLALVLLARKRKRDRQMAAAVLKDKSSSTHGQLGGSWSSQLSGDDELHHSLPYPEKSNQSHRPSAYGYRNSSVDHSTSASDDVEEQTRGMETAFHSTLVPKRTLRVMNADYQNYSYDDVRENINSEHPEEVELWKR